VRDVDTGAALAVYHGTDKRFTVFVRVKQEYGKDKKIHVHEVFTEEEIKNAKPLADELKKNIRHPYARGYAGCP
jgi:hypothetical protein